MTGRPGAGREAPVESVAPVRFRHVVVIGGGCYGTFYAGQLRQARARDRIVAERVILVDRNPDCQAARELAPEAGRSLVVSDWGAFLDRFFDREPPAPGTPDDAVVPSPLMPHLMAEWLLRVCRARWPGRAAEFAPVEAPLGTPYDVLGKDGNRYVSFADWLCPTHCVEPHICPVIRGPRTWEMREALAGYAARLNRERPTAGPALFVTRHRAFGVGMFDGAEVRAARALLEEIGGRPGPIDLVVATVSSCHGAISRLRIGPA